MKKLYEELELEIIRFGAADIITASDAAEDTTTKDDTATDDTADDTGDDDGGSDAAEGTSGKFYYGPDDARSESHVLTPSPEYDYGSSGDPNYMPAYTDENGNIWFVGQGGYVLATNPDNFV